MKTRILKLFLFIFLLDPIKTYSNNLPELGAQIWIEPGQNREQIDHWFEIMSDYELRSARLFIMWNFVETSPAHFDFTLYEWAFESAEKHNIKIQATLTPNHGPSFVDKRFWYKIQDGKIPERYEQMYDSEKYIEETVLHFKKHPALENWWLMNEPGQYPSNDKLAIDRFKDFLINKYGTIENLNDSWITNYMNFDQISYHDSWEAKGGFYSPAPFLDWNIFWKEHMTWYMKWVTEEIKRYDTTHLIHVNPHAIFDILYLYDLPEWGSFVSSIGASIHPAWHFGMLEEVQYAMGVSATCDIIKAAIEPKPFWISELQGGVNIFSSVSPMSPSADDISQWIWTGIGSGAEKVLLWCLNARSYGGEAGEWSLLSYQDQPSNRLIEISNISKTLSANQDFFSNCETEKARVTILLSPETMLIMKRKDIWNDIEGRKSSAHIKSALSFYETLLEMGIPVRFKQIDDMDWESEYQKKQVYIMPNVVSVHQQYNKKLEKLVQSGNKLIVTGLSAYFDEKEHNILLDDFPFTALFGGTIGHVKTNRILFEFKLEDPDIVLPSHKWYSELKTVHGKCIAYRDSQCVAIRNNISGGEVLWIPTMIGLGSWLSDNESLALLLDQELKSWIAPTPFRFNHHPRNIVSKTLVKSNEYILILTNGSKKDQKVSLGTNLKFVNEVYNNTDEQLSENNEIFLKGNKTVVLKFIQTK